MTGNYLKKGIGLILLCLGSSAYAQQVPDGKFELYLLIGQSNMAGRGPVTADFQDEGDSRVLMFNKNREWERAKHPLHFDKPGISGVGPGLAFGLAMAKARKAVKIGLIPCAVGGTAIEKWAPGAYDPVTKTHPFDDAVKRLQAAMAYGTIKGVIWHQGEANSSPEKAKIYLNQLSELIGRIREITAKPQLPFVAGELGRYKSNYAALNQQLELLPERVSFTAVASSKGLTDKGDHTHFDSKSARKMGERMAAKMLKLL